MKVKAWLLVCLLVMTVFHTGCGRAHVSTDTAEFEKAFHLAKGEKGAPEDPVVKGACEQVLAALKAEDLPRAIGPLMLLRYNRDLTVDQEIAVQNLAGGVQAKLAQQAERGDKAAIEAVAKMRSTGRQ